MNSLISKSDKIFVAGSAGMAGSAITRALIKNGYGNTSIGGELLTPLRNELDLLDYKKVVTWFETNLPDIVVLAAAKVGGIQVNSTNPTEFLLENIKIQTNVIENASKFKVKRLLFLGSSCIYPKFATQPIQEESLMTGSLEQTNEAYAVAKIAGIKLCQAYRSQYKFDAISLMPTNLYGPGDNYNKETSHVLPAMIRRFYEAMIYKKPFVTCWGSGNAKREFLHVDDLGDAAIFALQNWNPVSSELPFINVGSGIDITIKDLAIMIADLVGYRGEIRWDSRKPDGTPRKMLDVSRLTSLGWNNKISLREGMQMTIKQFSNEYNMGSIRI